MQLRSTRSSTPPLSADRALLLGLAPDGGLFVPERFPRLDPRLLAPGPLSYAELLGLVLGPWFDELPSPALAAAAERAVSRFEGPSPAPLVLAGDRPVLELFHGPTLAFKDLALTLFGDLLSLARRGTGLREELLVIVATSGDTGSAALAGLEDREGLRVVVLYPKAGISELQRLQMTTRTAKNCLVLGLEGNFDEAQAIAKRLLSDAAPRKAFAERGFLPCSANSINVGRLAPQLAYYVQAWRELRAAGLLDREGRFEVAVPSGNFGNVLAARYAAYEGLPLRSYLVATNRNRVLADFLSTGVYDRNRPFHMTNSPSMDILVSSNLERLIFEALGRDAGATAGLMAGLAAEGRFELPAGARGAFEGFSARAVGEEETLSEIRRVFEECGYLLDPHSATASAALRARGAGPSSLLVATASPLKFASTVAAALGLKGSPDEFDSLERLAERAGLPLPGPLASLRGLPERHDRVLAPAAVEAEILSWLGAAL